MTSIVDETRNSPILGHGHMTYIWTFLSSRNRHFSFQASPIQCDLFEPRSTFGAADAATRTGGWGETTASRLVTGRSLKMEFYCHKFPLPPLPRKTNTWFFQCFPPFQPAKLNRNSFKFFPGFHWAAFDFIVKLPWADRWDRGHRKMLAKWTTPWAPVSP